MKHFFDNLIQAIGNIFFPDFDDSDLMELIEKNKKIKIPTVRENWESVWGYFSIAVRKTA